jgi:hypothetical protein
VQEDLRWVDWAIEEITRGVNEPKCDLAWVIVLNPLSPNTDWDEGRGALVNLLGTIGPRETYFIPRNSDYLPLLHRPVKLGQFANNPASSADPDGPVPFSGFAGMLVCRKPTTFNISSHGAKYLKSSGFTRALGNKLGPDLTREANKGQTYKVFNLHKESIEPTDDCIRVSVQRPGAKKSLQGQIHSRTRRLFMVIGIKSASPVGARAGLREAFIYGYRLRGCYYRFQSLRSEDYVGDAIFRGGTRDARGTGDVEEFDVVYVDVDDGDIQAEEFGDPDNAGRFEVIPLVNEFDGSSSDAIIYSC